MNDQPLLKGNGTVSNEQMEEIAHKEYDEFNAIRKRYDAKKADEEDLKLLLEAQSRYERK